jgi:hypothetical protein
MLRYYQSYDKLKPHDGCKKLCHRLGFVSVLPLLVTAYGPQGGTTAIVLFEQSKCVDSIFTIDKRSLTVYNI